MHKSSVSAPALALSIATKSRENSALVYALDALQGTDEYSGALFRHVRAKNHENSSALPHLPQSTASAVEAEIVKISTAAIDSPRAAAQAP